MERTTKEFFSRNSEVFRSQHGRGHSSCSSIEVVWYPTLDSNNALLSTIPRIHEYLTLKQFRELFKKQPNYR